ncbi:hypothetical protein F5Y17DRAFT_444489 [Xylariaceae sp. FL0594]|nr:hypothetical protein F5Y17DRAFT_444489 [Xylariaceae sp. FL0594]
MAPRRRRPRTRSQKSGAAHGSEKKVPIKANITVRRSAAAETATANATANATVNATATVTATASTTTTTTTEPVVHASSLMPAGYVFVKKGNPYMTRHCRQDTQRARKTVYTVVDGKNRPVGIRVPKTIYEAVARSEKETRSQRREAVEKRDDALEKQFRKEILTKFPRVPVEDVPKIVKTAMKKHSGRVGRTGKLELAEKAFLAVQAHVRHTKTTYDTLLNQGVAYQDARDQTFPIVRETLLKWGARDLKPVVPLKGRGAVRKAVLKAKKKKNVVDPKTNPAKINAETTKKLGAGTRTRTPAGEMGSESEGEGEGEIEGEIEADSLFDSGSEFEFESEDYDYVTKKQEPNASGSVDRRRSLRSAGKVWGRGK